jgi:hypothetical protein
MLRGSSTCCSSWSRKASARALPSIENWKPVYLLSRPPRLPLSKRKLDPWHISTLGNRGTYLVTAPAIGSHQVLDGPVSSFRCFPNLPVMNPRVSRARPYSDVEYFRSSLRGL